MTISIINAALADDWYKDCPTWAREELPGGMASYRGVAGFDWELREALEKVMQGGPNGACVAGVDLYQANFFVPYRAETAEYLDKDYTPLKIHWPEGYLPLIRSMAKKAILGKHTTEEKVEALLDHISRHLLHPSIPPLGDDIATDRSLNEDELIESGTAWCNEQARVLIRACQAVEIPARIIHFFYTKFPTGHTVMEFFNGEKWCLVDTTLWMTFPDAQGHLMSTAECHDGSEGQARCQQAYHDAIKKLADQGPASVEEGNDPRFQKWVEENRHGLAKDRMQLRSFGVMNYPLPSEADLRNKPAP